MQTVSQYGARGKRPSAVLQWPRMLERVLKAVRIAEIGLTVRGEKNKLASHVTRMADAANLGLDVKDGVVAVIREQVSPEDFHAGLRPGKRIAPSVIKKVVEMQRQRREEKAKK